MDHYQYFIRDRRNFRNSRYEEQPAGFNFSTCPAPPTPINPKEEEKTNIEKLLKAAGIQSCSTDNTTVQASMAIVAPIGAGAAKVRVDKESTIGCESVMASSKKYAETVQSVTCMLNKSQNVVRQSLTSAQSIIFKAGRDAKIDCPRLKIKQGMAITMLSSINFDKKEISQISDKVKDVVKSLTKDVQSTETGTGTASKGSKILKEEVANINNINFDAKVSEAVNDINVALSTSQVVEFNAGRDLVVTGKDCEIEQDMVVKLAANTIVGNVVNSVMESFVEKLEETEETTEIRSKTEGVPEVEDAASGLGKMFQGLTGPFMIIAVVVIIALVMFGPMILKAVLGGDE